MIPEAAYLNDFLQKVKKLGWQEHEPVETVEGFIWPEEFERSLIRLNPILETLPPQARKMISEKAKAFLLNANPVETLHRIRQGIPIPKETGVHDTLILTLLSDQPEQNTFFYAREQRMREGDYTNRFDVAFWVNGLLLVMLEAKRWVDEKETLENAYQQVKRYAWQLPRAFHGIQYALLLADREAYLPVYPIGEREALPRPMQWKEEGKETILPLIRPAMLTRLVKHFIFYRSDKPPWEKIMPRYMQVEAVEKSMHRINAYLSGREEKNRGLIWHWQGSGKTLTMFFTAYQFLHAFKQKKPLVFITLDRQELEKQVLEAYTKLQLFDQTLIRRIASIRELEELIKHSDEAAGLYIVMTQKFTEAMFERVKKQYGQVEKREVLFLIDEVQRTQGGDLALFRRTLFPNAIEIGYTGTPLLWKKRRKSTFDEYAYPREGEFALHTYFIKQSQQDGFTLPFLYRAAYEMKDEEGNRIRLLIDKNQIRQILQRVYETAGEDEETLRALEEGKLIPKSKLRREINTTRVFLESTEWVKATTQYILNHLIRDLEGDEEKPLKEAISTVRFKAFIIAANRRACIKYKEMLDMLGLPAEASEIVMSYTMEDRNKYPDIAKYEKELLKRWNAASWQEANRKIQEAFKNPKEDPKILIVTDMLLTGFDAPILKTAYVSKLLFKHRLLQAIARTNRPYPGKRRGLIVDFIGLKGHLTHTLETYEALAQTDAEKTILNELKDALREEEEDVKHLEEYVSELQKTLTKSNIPYDTLLDMLTRHASGSLIRFFKEARENPIRQFTFLLLKGDERARKAYSHMREAISLYQSLGGTPAKEPYRYHIKLIRLLKYLIDRERYRGTPRFDWDALRREIQDDLIIHEIVDAYENELLLPEKSRTPSDVFIAYYTEARNSLSDLLNTPLYKAVYERLQRLKEQWDTRDEEDHALLEEAERLAQKLKGIAQARSSFRKRLKEYLKVYHTEHQELPKEIITLAEKVFSDGERLTEHAEKHFRRELVRLLLRAKREGRITEWKAYEQDILELVRRAGEA